MNQDLQTLLNAIDEWIDQLSDDAIREHCRLEGSAFFKFMTVRGVDPGWCANLIMETTGFHPRQLWRIENVLLVKESLSSYLYSMTGIAHAEQTKDIKNPRKHAQEVSENVWRARWN